MPERDWLCPECGGPTDYDYDCPGYPMGTKDDGSPQIMVCSYGCGNATKYFCKSDDCGWWWREPNNRNSKGMGPRPDWLEEADKATQFILDE